MAGGLAGAALLLAFLFHQNVAAVGVAILGALPITYLAWKVLPAPAKKPDRGRRVREWDPVGLGVHQVVGGGPMPPYIRRKHDELLAAVLDPVAPASRLVVLRGGSSTGKSRAAYQAVIDQLADWRLDYPQDPGTLTALLDDGIPARTVLWLGELRDYADTDGGPAAMARLAKLLDGRGRSIIVITTVWPGHWGEYTEAARAAAGSAALAGVAGRLLRRLPDLTDKDPAYIEAARGGVIDVPAEFTVADMDAAARTGDAVLSQAASAAAAAGQGRQVTQYLAGVPALLDRYAGPGGDAYGQAVITAAMDAARLGHASPLPPVLLPEAAVGYLGDEQRTRPLTSWAQPALDWAADELDGAIRALKPIPPPSGTGVASYKVADYLDQHGRRTRQDQLGFVSLWDALAAHTTSPTDLSRLGRAAQDRGLYRHAITLWTNGTALGSAAAAYQLIDLLRQMRSADTTSAAHWAAVQVSLEEPGEVARLLAQLRLAGTDEAARALLARNPGAKASLNDSGGVATLLAELRLAGAGEPPQAMLARDHAGQLLEVLRRSGVDEEKARALLDPADQASLSDPEGAMLPLAGAGEAARVLLARDPADQASLDDPEGAAMLLAELRQAGENDAGRHLATRAAAQASLSYPTGVATLLAELRHGGTSDAAKALAERAIAQARHQPLWLVAWLVQELRRAGAEDAANALAEQAATHARLDSDNLWEGTWLITELRHAGADDAAKVLAERAVAQASLDNPKGVATLLAELRKVGNDDAVRTLAKRAADRVHRDKLLEALAEDDDRARTLAERAPAPPGLDDPQGVAMLMTELRQAGAGDVATTLGAWAAAHASLDDPQGVATLLAELRQAGDLDAAMAPVAAAVDRFYIALAEAQAILDNLADMGMGGDDDGAQSLTEPGPAHAGPDGPEGAGILPDELPLAGYGEAAQILLARDPASNVSLDDLGGIAMLLRVLRRIGADDAAQILLARDPAAHVSLSDWWDVAGRPARPDIAQLVKDLREAGAGDAAQALAGRAANAGTFDLLLEEYAEEADRYRFGREPDGTPSRPWAWQKPERP